MAYPILAGGSQSYFYEVVWRYTDSWRRMGDRIGQRHHSVEAPCGAFSPLGIDPNFYMGPPWKVYQVFWYTGNTWHMCHQERNW